MPVAQMEIPARFLRIPGLFGFPEDRMPQEAVLPVAGMRPDGGKRPDLLIDLKIANGCIPPVLCLPVRAGNKKSGQTDYPLRNVLCLT